MSEQINTPKLRFPEFRDEWKMKIIKELFNVVSGSTPLRSNTSYYENGNIPWVKTTDLNNSLINDTSEKVTDIALNNLKLLPKDTVLIAMYGGFNQIGRTGILNIKATTNQAISALIKKDDYNSKFLQSYLNFNVKQWRRFAASSRKDPNITKKDIEKFKIPYTCREEQEKIGTFFSKLDRQIELEEEKLELLEQQKKGYIQKIFSQELRFKDKKDNYYSDWKNYQLKDLTYYKNGKGYEKVATTNGKYNIINLNSIGVKGQLKDSGKYTDFEDETLLKNDLIMILSDVAKGNLIGMTTIIDENNKYLLNQRIALLRIKNSLITNAYFLYLYINFNRKYFINMSTGMSQLNINKKTVEDFQVNLPSIEEQDKIAILFKNYEDTIKKQASKVKLLKQRKQGLLQKMFV
ncbi:TPA: restriction endonuclease subunit S [Staphylococcus aureus]|nr:restriction endonuclease subunit S [Staphylococcus aureus]